MEGKAEEGGAFRGHVVDVGRSTLPGRARLRPIASDRVRTITLSPLQVHVPPTAYYRIMRYLRTEASLLLLYRLHSISGR